MSRLSQGLFLFALVAFGPAALGAPPVADGKDRPAEPTKVARTDAQGDPLPEGALARLGTVRFRHCGEVTALAFSPDGKLILSGGGQWDESVSLWDAATGVRRLRLPGRYEVMAVAFTRDGKRFAAGFSASRFEADMYVCIWETATGKELHRLATGYNARGLVFSPDGRTLLINGSKGARLWEPERKTTQQLEGQPAYGNVAAFAPDGRVIATGSTEYKDPKHLGGAEHLIRLWDASSGQLLHTLRGHEQRLEVLTFSPDGKLLASGGGWGGESSVRLWDVASGRERPALPGREGNAYALFFSSDGKSLCAARSDGVLRVWELPSGKVLPAPKLESPDPGSEAAAFSPDGKRLARGSWLGAVDRANTIRVWDLTNGRCCAAVPGHQGDVKALAFSPDGRRLASGGHDGALLWDVARQRVLRRLTDDTTRTSTALAFSPDGSLVACGDEEGFLVAWEVESAKERFRARLTRKRTRSEEDSDPDADRPSPAGKILFSADGRRLVAKTDGAVLAWDLPPRGRAPAEPARLPEQERGQAPIDLNFFGSGAVLTLASEVSSFRWDAASGTVQARTGRKVDLDKVLVWPSWAVQSPDGRLLAVGSHTGALAVWELATGEEVLRLQRGGAEGADVRMLAFDPSGRLLAAGQVDGIVRIWDCASGKQLWWRQGHLGRVRALAFAPDGRVLASGGSDTTVLLWDLSGLSRAEKSAARLGAKELEDRWRLLAGTDAAAAHRAAAEMAADPERALPFLAEQLKPPAERDVERLIADLDADAFDTRQRGSAELKRLGTAAEPAMRRALERKPSAEAQRRLKELLEALSKRPSGVLTGDAVRMARVLRVLEQAGTPEARRLLRQLARDGYGPDLRAGAAAALERLKRLAP